MKTKIGQNFLVDKYIIKKFISIINPQKNEYFIEIGSGYGNITDFFILNKIKHLFLIELDFNIYKFLLKKFSNYKNITIINYDARFININKLLKKKSKFRIFGGIPYYATISIIFNLIKFINNIYDINFIIQKELSNKITASYNSKNYNKLSININIFFDSYIMYNTIHPISFKPQPKILSSIIKMIPNIKFNLSKNELKIFKYILNCSFSNRRKILKNNLNKLFNVNSYELSNIINLNLRPQNISIYDYYKLFKYYIKK